MSDGKHAEYREEECTSMPKIQKETTMKKEEHHAAEAEAIPFTKEMTATERKETTAQSK